MPKGCTAVWAISIHAPRTGSDCVFSILLFMFVISIHAPRTGSDFCAGDGFAAGG